MSRTEQGFTHPHLHVASCRTGEPVMGVPAGSVPDAMPILTHRPAVVGRIDTDKWIQVDLSGSKHIRLRPHTAAGGQYQNGGRGDRMPQPKQIQLSGSTQI